MEQNLLDSVVEKLKEKMVDMGMPKSFEITVKDNFGEKSEISADIGALIKFFTLNNNGQRVISEIGVDTFVESHFTQYLIWLDSYLTDLIAFKAGDEESTLSLFTFNSNNKVVSIQFNGKEIMSQEFSNFEDVLTFYMKLNVYELRKTSKIF